MYLHYAPDDLSDFLAKAKPLPYRLHFVPKDATMTIRLPQSVIDGAKKVAKKRKVKYQSLLREAIVDFWSGRADFRVLG